MFGAFHSVSERLNIPFKELALASDENQVCLLHDRHIIQLVGEDGKAR